jgi:hypothetical protein
MLDATLIKLLPIHIPLQVIQCLPEALEVDDLSFPQEFQAVCQIRVIGKVDQILIGCPGLLFCCHVLMEISYGVSHGIDVGGC